MLDAFTTAIKTLFALGRSGAMSPAEAGARRPVGCPGTPERVEDLMAMLDDVGIPAAPDGEDDGPET